ncbi:MAG: AI-2E family transporter [Elusimicrobiaceae bacterium]
MTTADKKASGITLAALLIIFLSVFLFMIWPYLIALLMGLLLAILSRPLYNILLKKGLGPRTAASIALAVILLAIITPLAVFAGVAIKQAIAISATFSGERAGELLKTATARFASLKPAQWLIAHPVDLQTKILEFAQSAGGALSRLMLVHAAALPDMAVKIVIALLSWFFLLFQGDNFFNWLISKVPLDAALRKRLVSSLRATAVSTVWASAAAAAAQALVVMAGFWVLDVPAIFLAGGTTFIFAWIPLLGSLPVCLVGAAYLYFTSPLFMPILMCVVAIIAGLIDNVVRPIVLNGRGEMHPLLALVAIFGGIRMFGLLGVIFGPIVAAILLALLNSWKISPAATEEK